MKIKRKYSNHGFKKSKQRIGSSLPSIETLFIRGINAKYVDRNEYPELYTYICSKYKSSNIKYRILGESFFIIGGNNRVLTAYKIEDPTAREQALTISRLRKAYIFDKKRKREKLKLERKGGKDKQ